MNTLWWTAAFMTGLAGSLHCVGMCGPLAMALPLGRLPRWQRPWGILTYHVGRIAAYAGLGAVFGLLGQGLLLISLQRPVSIGAGLLLVVWGLTGTSGSPLSRWLPQRTGLSSALGRLLHRPSLPAWLGMGFLNGLLPCGFVYVALASTLVSDTILAGMSYMVSFGLGTLPALLGVRVLTGYLSQPLRRQFSRALPIVTLLLGTWLLIRGLGIYPAMPLGPVDDMKAIPLCHG
ncbi:sulfite exporter TauE/SafE family protein [Fibrisoma montanum]|uniref:Sulfite exporter TauE/SafE family protein n=1 Tax=Fibrisoma montanum TaxID=2305895 RepID=A0A418LWM9_9BACT|nr:sulfite exporter TauE/SafE family protein [Fibrisoma montanum]RIV17719.1 sulfite exporter TauE/SafE family protein [Fibrisoma montanum]